MTKLVRYEAARAALAEARTLADVKDIRDKAEAMRAYALMAEDKQLEMDAGDIRTRAEHMLGVMLRKTDRNKGTRGTGDANIGRATGGAWDEPPVDDAPTLKELGISKHLSVRAQRLAQVPEDELEAALARARQRYEDGAKHFSIDVTQPINGARAIMGSRQEPDDSLDYFPTPPWATRALMERVFPQLDITGPIKRAWEPACGEGHIAEVLSEYCETVCATDIYEYGYGAAIQDFLEADAPQGVLADWIITNPPFGEKTEAFVLRAIDLADVGVAMFVRLQWIETIGRYERLFRDKPPTLVAFFCERVNLCKGEWNPTGGTATAYIWLVWVKDAKPQAPFWIPPGCKRDLTHPDDAARFTAHPVIKKQNYDPTTGEIAA